MRSTYNPDNFMVFYKDKGLFETELMTKKEVKESLAWQKRGGFDASDFIVCHYDYIAEEFFNDDHVIDITDINKGVMKDRVLTEFKARFFPNKLTKQLDMAQTALSGIIESFHESVKTDDALDEFPHLWACVKALETMTGKASA